MDKFQGGKLFHIFDTQVSGKNLLYIDQFSSEHAKEALEQGVCLLKVDGSCSALFNENGQWKVYERRDNYNGTDVIPLPEGLQPSLYDQGGKEHKYTYRYIEPEYQVSEKKKTNEGPDMYAIVQKAVEQGHLPKPDDPDAPPFITGEWVGCKKQGNRDELVVMNGFVPHRPPFTPVITDIKSLADFQALANKECFEGIVVVHPDGTRYKMRCSMLQGGSLWSNPKNKSTIKPLVLTVSGLWNPLTKSYT